MTKCRSTPDGSSGGCRGNGGPVTSGGVARTVAIRRAILLISAAALVWAWVIAWTGGFSFQLGSLRFASRNPSNPRLIALAAALGALVLYRSGGFRTSLKEDWEWCQPAVRPLGRFIDWRAALALAAIGIAVDVYQWLGAPPLWLDEEMIALNVRDRSFLELAGPLWLEQSAPYGWLVLQRAALLTLGDGELAMRFLPLVFGAATLLGAVWIGRRWLSGAGTLGLVLLCWMAQSLSHYRFEVKHYTADAFFALLLPALVVWALEAETRSMRVRRALIWWTTAAGAQWLANGALLVTPGCAVVLLAGIWRRDGWRASGAAAAGGAIWLAAVLGHYELSLRYTGHLRDYWRDRFPPQSAGVRGMVRWFASCLGPIANDPGGTRRWRSLWLLAVCGFAFGPARWLGVAFATVAASAFVYAGLGLVPLYARFSIWIVPALYVGVMLFADRAVRMARFAWAREQWLSLVVPIAIVASTVALGMDIVSQGENDLNIPHVHHKQQLDDRAAVRWLLDQWRSGDIMLTTRFGWAAVWWYGRIPIGDDAHAPRPVVDAASSYEIMHLPPGPECRAQPLEETSTAARRLLVYLGFRDVPPGFEALLMHSLEQVGVVTQYAELAGLGRAAVVDLETPNMHVDLPARRHQPFVGRPLEGCVGIRPARRW